MNRLRELRLGIPLTQTQLSEKIGVNQSAIGKYERGELEPNIDTLKKFATFFECSIDYLLGFSDDFGNITVYQTTNNLHSLSSDEQRLIDCIRKNPPHNATEWISLYAELPRYLQENIFAELKGVHLAHKTTNLKRQEN